MSKWKIYERKGRAFRTERADWVLVGSYDTEKDARKAYDLRVGRNSLEFFGSTLVKRQTKLVPPKEK